MTGSPGPGNLLMMAGGASLNFKKCTYFLIGLVAGKTLVNFLIFLGLGAIVINNNIIFEVLTGTPNPVEATVNYKWQIFDDDSSIWINLSEDETYSGVSTNKLTISNINSSMSGKKYRTNVSTSEYLCGVNSDEAILTVVATPKKPTVPPVQTYCFDVSNQPKVSDLTINDPDSTLNVFWYDAETGGDPIDSNTELIHDKKYYAEVVNSLGCSSSVRTETKAFVSNPTLTATNNSLCLSESTTLSVTGIPQTAEDFINDHPELQLFLTFLS